MPRREAHWAAADRQGPKRRRKRRDIGDFAAEERQTVGEDDEVRKRI